MIKEKMTREERVLAAINLEPYDRVPVVPLIDTTFPFRHKGRHAADAYNPALVEDGFQATLDLFDEVGGWDGACMLQNFPVTPDSSLYIAHEETSKFPGQDDRFSVDSSQQFEEQEILKVEDYDEIINLGWRGFIKKNTERFSHTISPFYGEPDRYIRCRDTWHKREVPIIASVLLRDPQMALSLLRTLPQFTLDMYRRPDKVEAALDAIVGDFTRDAIEAMLLSGASPPTGIPGITMSCERGSGSYCNLKLFERFVWPYIKQIVEAFAAAGFVTTLHFDTDWTRNLPYLLELPKKKCICELDSTTDIFKAKEILKDHMCIKGDVPPALLSHGTPEEVEAYCQKLIDIVGKDTGFILSSGCLVPPDTKFENFKMMIDTAKNYPPPCSTASRCF